MTEIDANAARAEKLSRELDAAFRNRADLYRLMLDELTAELGADKAEELLVRAIEKRGREVAAGFDVFHRGSPFQPTLGRLPRCPQDSESSNSGTCRAVRG